MTDEQRDRSDCMEGVSEAAGRAIDPFDLGEEAAAARDRRRAVPIGRPIPPAEYARLKEAAARDTAPPAPSAQEDSAGSAVGRRAPAGATPSTPPSCRTPTAT